MAKRVLVSDLDGTLSDSRAREHLLPDFDAFHEAGRKDPPNWDVLAMVQAAVDFGFELLILTGRNEAYREATIDWLERRCKLYHLDDYRLLMRPDGDFRPDVETKESLLRGFYGELPPADRTVFLEDRDKLVEHWRNLGYCCWQVRVAGY